MAATNFLLWGPITGDKPPIESKEDNGPPSLKTKAEIIKYLKDSFALGHKAAQSIHGRKCGGTGFQPVWPGTDHQALLRYVSPWPMLLITTARWWNTCA